MDNRSAANGSGTAVDWIAEVLAVGPDESLGSFRIDDGGDSLFALAVNDRFDNIFALLLSFEPIAAGAVAEVLPLDPETGREGPVATLPVLNRYHDGVSKCEVNIALNKGV